MKALVTGATGFIGSTLVEELSQAGIQVRALMRKTSSSANLEGLNFERTEGDLADFDALKKAVQGVDLVFHLAGVVIAKNREGFFEHNASGTERLARAVAEANPGLKRFVYVSSLAAGGPTLSADPRQETHEDQPVSSYGLSKRQGEIELLKYKSTYPISIVRPPLVYGPKDKATFLFVKTVAKNIVPMFAAGTESGQKYYSGIHVRDLVRGIIQAAQVPVTKAPSGEIFYLAADDIFTYEQMMMTIAKNLDRKPLRFKIPIITLKIAATGLTALGKLTNKTYPLNLDKLNEILPDYWICSNHKAKSILGFQPEYDLTRGLENTVTWYRNHRWI